MNRQKFILLLLAGLCLALSGCEDDDFIGNTKVGRVDECHVAVVLPFSDGLEAHWKQCLKLCSDNLYKASLQNGSGVRLVYDFYDEESPNLTDIAKSLAADEGITAVIGGFYSSNAITLANVFSKANKPFFTIATTEQLVRAYSSWGNLWAMTESNITQCEVLLSKAMQYGASKVALFTDKESAYGQTFINWFAFLAVELGMQCEGVYEYDDDLAAQATEAVNSDADFLICAAPSVPDLKAFLQIYQKSDHRVRLLCTDCAYGTHVLAQLGQYAEGIEGVCYGSAPESGFDLAYKTYFGTEISLGESQIYDAAMLIGYAQYIRMQKKGKLSFRDAMRQLVSGREAVNATWHAEDMAKILRILAEGGHPDIAGASGSLDFDSKVYTNVLSTTYNNYLIYDNHCIILDYNSTDGSRRAEPTLAEWNWKASQMQDIKDSSSTVREYPPLDQKWALLVATSSGWDNYRHQVDVLNIYQQLKTHGYQDDHIILIMEDDLAYHTSNPHPGTLISRMGAENVYRDVEVDYHTRDLSPSDIGDILSGKQSERLPQVILSDSDDNIFIFWSGHGMPGALCWLDNSYGMTAPMMDGILTNMENRGNYRKITGCIETCYSGSVFDVADQHNGVLFFTASNGQETSKADEYNYDMDVWMSNRFTATLQDCFVKDPDMSMRNLYFRLFQSTVGSHVCVYGIDGYGSLYSTYLDEIL